MKDFINLYSIMLVTHLEKKGGIVLNFSVAIDGPAGAGKSTIAKIVSNKFNLMYINTGSLYRAITFNAIGENIRPYEVEKICKLIDKLEMHFDEDNLILNNVDISDKIRLPEISRNVHYYSAIPEVREKMLKILRDMAKKYNVIMDGRDIGTVVLKDAIIKLFITAGSAIRATRRFNELEEKGLKVNYDTILKNIKERDFNDINRAVAPLRKAEDAIEIDTSYMALDEVVEFISNAINKRVFQK